MPWLPRNSPTTLRNAEIVSTANGRATILIDGGAQLGVPIYGAAPANGSKVLVAVQGDQMTVLSPGGSGGGSGPAPSDSGGPSAPVGAIMAFGTGAFPEGWLWCAGQAVSRTTYSSLFAKIGTQYGAGDGSTTFNVPNLTGRIPIGRGPGDPEVDPVGKLGGSKVHTLTVDNLPAHSHGFQLSTSWPIGGGPGESFTGWGTGKGYFQQGVSGTSNTGLGHSVNHMPPFQVVEYAIKAVAGPAEIPNGYIRGTIGAKSVTSAGGAFNTLTVTAQRNVTGGASVFTVLQTGYWTISLITTGWVGVGNTHRTFQSIVSGTLYWRNNVGYAEDRVATTATAYLTAGSGVAFEGYTTGPASTVSGFYWAKYLGPE